MKFPHYRQHFNQAELKKDEPAVRFRIGYFHGLSGIQFMDPYDVVIPENSGTDEVAYRNLIELMLFDENGDVTDVALFRGSELKLALKNMIDMQNASGDAGTVEKAEAHFIKHCDEEYCELGTFECSCPKCHASIIDYDVWWRMEDIINGMPEGFECENCNANLLAKYDEDGAKFFVDIHTGR